MQRVNKDIVGKLSHFVSFSVPSSSSVQLSFLKVNHESTLISEPRVLYPREKIQERKMVFTKARTTQPLRRFNKTAYNLHKLSTCHCSITRGRTLVNVQGASLHCYTHQQFCTFRQHCTPLHYTQILTMFLGHFNNLI